MENNTKRRMLTIGEAAHLIEGITEYRIRTLCKSGQLRSFKAGNKFLIAEDDLYEVVFGTDSVKLDFQSYEYNPDKRYQIYLLNDRAKVLCPAVGLFASK